MSLTSLKITQAFHLLIDFAENQDVFSDLKIQNSVWITEGSDNGDSDNRGSTVLNLVMKEKSPNHRIKICQIYHVYGSPSVTFQLVFQNPVTNYVNPLCDTLCSTTFW